MKIKEVKLLALKGEDPRKRKGKNEDVMGITIWAKSNIVCSPKQEMEFELAFLESLQKNKSRWMTQEEQDRLLELRKKLFG